MKSGWRDENIWEFEFDIKMIKLIFKE